MEHLTEFIGNHIFLWGALAAVLVLLIKAEFEHQSGKANQLNPVNAIRVMNNEDALVLDVRESAEFGKGHIKSAKNVPFASLKDKLKDFAKHKETAVLAYCNTGAVSNKACKVLQQEGFTKVHNIAGGINSWLDAKLPVTKK
jgi:rhodanese-related sulfurtransferase